MTAEGDSLVATLGRFADILRRGDAASAETVDINENANDGSNEPAGRTCFRTFSVECIGRDGLTFCTWGVYRTIDEARIEARKCANKYANTMIVASEIVELVDGCVHA